MFQFYPGSFTTYMCNAYIAVCTCINILVYIQCDMTVHICDILCLINYILYYIITVCTLV